MKINGITVTPKKIKKVILMPSIRGTDQFFPYNPKWFICHKMTEIVLDPNDPDSKNSDLTRCHAYSSYMGDSPYDFDRFTFVRLGRTIFNTTVFLTTFTNGYLFAYTIGDSDVVSNVEFVSTDIPNPFAGLVFKEPINENFGVALSVFLGIPAGGALDIELSDHHQSKLYIVTDAYGNHYISLFASNRFLDNKVYSDFTRMNLGYGYGIREVKTKYSKCKKPLIMYDNNIIMQIDEYAETGNVKNPNRFYNIDHKNNTGNWLTSFSFASPDEVVNTYNAFTPSGRASIDSVDLVDSSSSKHEVTVFNLQNASKMSGTYLLEYGDNSDSVLYYSLDDDEYPVEKEMV